MKAKNHSERCSVAWNPGVWPYATRCVERKHRGTTHTDHRGRTLNTKTGERTAPTTPEENQ